MRFLLSVAILLGGARALAGVISNSADEIEYSFEVTFKTPYNVSLTKAQTIDAALFHASHVDGLFHSKSYAEKFGVSTELTEGFAGSQYPGVLEAQSYLASDGHIWVGYKATAKALVLKKVLQGWIGTNDSGVVELPMFIDVSAIYNDDLTWYSNEKWKKCTDAHYSGADDFYYFYDPFRCAEIGKSPIGEMVKFKIKRVAAGSNTAKVPKADLRGDNGNGRLQTFYFVNGFDELAAGSDISLIKKDYGWKQYAGLAIMLEARGFRRMDSKAALTAELGADAGEIEILTPVTMENPSQRRFFSTFVKKEGGITYVARAGLFPTENASTGDPLVSFPKFWKEAWENGDFIYYNGHSGLGHHLSLDVMLYNLSVNAVEGIRFWNNKTQIAFLDSCSSYAHYQELYQNEANGLHIMTYGVVSLFHLAPASLETMVDTLLGDSVAPTWAETLEKIERAQLRPAVEFAWNKADVEETIRYFEREKQYPAFMLNVSLPK